MKIVSRRFMFACLVALVMLAVGGSAWAKDAVVGAVAPVSPTSLVMLQNGTQYSNGTYAVGTIQLFYTVQAYQFTAGKFGGFTLDLSIQPGKSSPATNYPVNYLTLKQTGSANLKLLPAKDSFSVTDAYWHDWTTINIEIPQSVASDPAFQADGAELVANLQMVAPNRSNLDTVTTIQIHLILVHPTDCLKLYSFITNNDISAQIDTIQISKSKGSGNLSSAPQNPHYIIVVANTCDGGQCIDSRFELDSAFQLKGAQAVKTFSSNSLTDTFAEVSTFFDGAPTAQPKGVNMCLTAPASATCGSGGIVVLGGETFLIKADFEIKADASFPPPSQYTGFSASVLDGGSTGNCTVPGKPNSVATPNSLSSGLNTDCVDGPGKVSCTP